MKKCLSKLKRVAIGFGKTLLELLALPPVRNFIWNKLIGKSEEKIIEAKAKLVEENQNKRGWFR